MKRALKKRVKAVLENTPGSDDAPMDQLNVANNKANRRARTQVAMIGLAISMGATSLLVTRQSDQAQAAAPVGSQKAASTVPTASDNEVKFAPTKLGTPVVLSASVPENPVIVEPTAVSQLPGLEAKWQVLASGMSEPASTSETLSQNLVTYKTSIDQQEQESQQQQAKESVEELAKTNDINGEQTAFIKTQPQTEAADSAAASGEMNLQLKAQQEFALNRLQEKSNRLRKSLAELRSEESKDLSKDLSKNPSGLKQPTAIANQLPPLSINGTVIEQSPIPTNGNQDDLATSVKQPQAITIPVQPPAITAPIVAPKITAPSQQANYEVKPGDTLAAIANRYNTSVSELAKANGLSDPNQLKISQQLVIPVTQNPINRQYGINSEIASIPLNTTSINSQPITSQTPVLADNSDSNSLAVPTTATEDSENQANTPVEPETTANNPITQGIGGDTPVPRVFVEMQKPKKSTDRVASAKNERLRGLQAEIQRLQAKYRAQNAGNNAASETRDAAIPIPVATPNGLAVSRPVSNQTEFSIPIAVPTPLTPGYANQPVKPEFRATRPLNNEPINPEFLPNNGASQLKPSQNPSGIRIATPPAGVNASDSLGRMRGTTVSPAKLPPLAAVDQYLPRTIDESTPLPSDSSTAFTWPAKGVLTSGYGWRWGRMHRGIDIANGVGTPIVTASDGIVEKAGWNNGGYGILVDIRHPDGTLTRYAHNSKIFVRAGQQVQKGQHIANMGSTGFSTGPHLHFEIHTPGKGAINPIAMLPKNRI
ncbi:peptidoglycan DD-metalloendopeptidase family protein [Nostoc sp. UHCC 0870]|uniref:peptidoglycan DD-metalloendopeptidase family protein n=1 Tax=Nostoc sp. UHCC 0870 TaxID=2914041 RepID=UPI001EE04F64|nr:LysM peptidoglycan-binding domain-containing M23 family metallopeptidase [Nostoc sp. UHCC 0870]UKO98118.1 peptidoglycan DD-metalloendopeptidase family protein [Nostoc sp. UHCC 0870]